MKTLWLASMKWPGIAEPICVGTNKRRVQNEAYRMLREEHGTGNVDRNAAMCSAPIQHDDIEISPIPFYQP